MQVNNVLVATVEVIQKENKELFIIQQKLEHALLKEPWKPFADFERYKNLNSVLIQRKVH